VKGLTLAGYFAARAADQFEGNKVSNPLKAEIHLC